VEQAAVKELKLKSQRELPQLSDGDGPGGDDGWPAPDGEVGGLGAGIPGPFGVARTANPTHTGSDGENG